MHLYSPTDDAVLLLSCKDSNGVMRFPTTRGVLPGICINVKGLTSINTQLLAAAEPFIQIQSLGSKLVIEQEFRGECRLADGKSMSLYCGILNAPEFSPPEGWMTIAEIIRGLMKDPNRVVYMKALQVFSGGLNSNLRAVVPDHLKEEIH